VVFLPGINQCTVLRTQRELCSFRNAFGGVVIVVPGTSTLGRSRFRFRFRFRSCSCSCSRRRKLLFLLPCPLPLPLPPQFLPHARSAPQQREPSSRRSTASPAASNWRGQSSMVASTASVTTQQPTFTFSVNFSLLIDSADSVDSIKSRTLRNGPLLNWVSIQHSAFSIQHRISHTVPGSWI